MNEKYAKAYVEVLEILNHLPAEEYLKIPKEKIEFFNQNKNSQYTFKINPDIDLSEQNLLKETEIVMVILFRDYFASEKQKEILDNLLKQNYEKKENEKYNKYNPDNIFKNKIQPIANSKETALVELKKETWYKKILNYFRNLFVK